MPVGATVGIIIFILLVIILIILKATGVIPSATERSGNKGERRVNSSLSWLLEDGDKLLTNLLMPVGNGYKTEIDTILISKKGVFCIEIKNWNGYINGDDNSQSWCQTSYYHKKYQNTHYNPVKQNASHVKAVRRAINYNEEVKNVVILTGFEKNYVKSNFTYDTDSFKQHYRSLPNILSEKETFNIYSRLIEYVATKEELEKHKKEVKQLHN